jgi:hypothetical protein
VHATEQRTLSKPCFNRERDVAAGHRPPRRKALR